MIRAEYRDACARAFADRYAGTPRGISRLRGMIATAERLSRQMGCRFEPYPSVRALLLEKKDA